MREHAAYPTRSGRRRGVRQVDAVIALAIMALGATFMLLSAFVNVRIGIAGVIALLCVMAAFVSAHVVMYILIFLMSFPVPFQIGPQVLMLQDFTILLVFFALVIRIAFRKHLVLPHNMYLAAAGAMIVSMILSSLASARISVTMPEILQYFYYIFMIPFLIMNMIDKPEDISRYLKFHAGMLVLHAFVIILQYELGMAGNMAIADTLSYANRGGYTLRSYGAMGPAAGWHLAIAAIVLLNAVYGAKGWPAQSFYLFCLGVVVFATICTGIRSMTLYICVALLGYLVYRRRYIEFAVFMLLFLVTVLYVIGEGANVYPFKLFYHGEAFRYQDINQGWEAFQQNVVFGTGPMQFLRTRGATEVTGLENEFVARLAEGGIIGGFAFLFWLFAVYFGLISTIARRGREKFGETPGLLLFIFSVYVVAVFSVSEVFTGGSAHLFMLFIAYILKISAPSTMVPAPAMRTDAVKTRSIRRKRRARRERA